MREAEAGLSSDPRAKAEWRKEYQSELGGSHHHHTSTSSSLLKTAKLHPGAQHSVPGIKYTTLGSLWSQSSSSGSFTALGSYRNPEFTVRESPGLNCKGHTSNLHPWPEHLGIFLPNNISASRTDQKYDQELVFTGSDSVHLLSTHLMLKPSILKWNNWS